MLSGLVVVFSSFTRRIFSPNQRERYKWEERARERAEERDVSVLVWVTMKYSHNERFHSADSGLFVDLVATQIDASLQSNVMQSGPRAHTHTHSLLCIYVCVCEII